MAKPIKTSKFQDLGEVINEATVADAGYAWSSFIYNSKKTKRIILHCKSTKSFEIYCVKENKDGVVDWGNAVQTGLSQTAGVYSGVTIDAATSILGYGFKIGMKNVSGDASTADFEMKMQLIG